MQKKKKVPLRKCLGCNEMKPKKEMIRIVKNNEQIVSVDRTGKAPGRGCYICPDRTCFEKAIKSKRIQAALETSISEEIINELKKRIEQNDE